jgi:hypothetical protein
LSPPTENLSVRSDERERETEGRAESVMSE